MEPGIASFQVLAIAAIAAVLLVYLFMFRRTRLEVSNKAVLVTSCDTAVGLGCAKKLDSLGFRVFAGFADPDSPESRKLREVGTERLRVVQFDANNCEKLDNAVEYIHRHLPTDENGLWAVINTSSKCISGLLDKLSWDQCERQVHVNLVAAIRLAKTFLPGLKRRKGRMVTVASLGGQLSYPGFAVYSGCKAALEGFYESLRYEMHGSGVSFITVSPSIQYRFETKPEPAQCIPVKFGDQAKLCVFDTRTIEALLDTVEEAVLASDPLPQYILPPVHNRVWALVTSSLPAVIKRQKLSRDFKSSFFGEDTV